MTHCQTEWELGTRSTLPTLFIDTQNLLSASQYRSSLVFLIALRPALLVSRVEGTISLELKEIYLKLSVLHSRALESALRMSTTQTTARDIKYIDKQLPICNCFVQQIGFRQLYPSWGFSSNPNV